MGWEWDGNGAPPSPATHRLLQLLSGGLTRRLRPHSRSSTCQITDAAAAAPGAAAKPSPLKPAAKPTAAAKPVAAPASGKGKKELHGVTLDGTGEGTVRVHIGDAWRAFYLSNSTTVDDLVNLVQLRCSALLAQLGLDAAPCGLYELKNVMRTAPRLGSPGALTCSDFSPPQTRFP